MRKVIGFKLAIRPKELQRRAKKSKIDLASIGLDEPALQALVDDVQRALKPAVLFETFPQADSDQAALSPIPGLAYSLVLATLGEGFAKVQSEKPAAAALWPIVGEHALEECVRFAASLIEDEAKAESCELSPISPVTEPAALETALRKLDGAKIGVGLAEGTLSPAASAACSLSWLSKSKAKGGPPPRGKTK